MRKLSLRPADFFIAAAAVIVCCGGGIYGVMPFGAPMFIALCPHIFIGAIAPVYVLCSFLFTFDVWRLYASGTVVFVQAAVWLLGLKFKKFEKDFVRIIFGMIAIAADACFCGFFDSAAYGFMTFAVGGVFFCFARLAAACMMKKFAIRPCRAETVAFGVFLFVAGLAFGAACRGNVYAGLGLAFLSSLMLGAAGQKQAFGGTAAMALGLAFSVGAPLSLCFLACGVACAVFSSMCRPLYVAVGLGVFVAAEVLASVPLISIGWSVLAVGVGGIIFCLLPKKAIRRIGEYFDYDGAARLALRYYINRTRADAGNKMLNLASVFDETARLLGAFKRPPTDYRAIGYSLSDRFCPYCANNGVCDEQKRDDSFAELAENVYNGKPIIADLPPFFSDCARTAEVVAAATEITEMAKRDEQAASSDEKAKKIVVERMAAVKDVLNDLGDDQSRPVGFDGEKERRAAMELSLAGAECADVLVSDNGALTAVVRTGVKAETIRRAVSAALKREYALVSFDRSAAAGWSVAALAPATEYEAVYARAGVGKTGGISGDSYTFKRIGDRFLVALADGMGQGERASVDSDSAIELIECFYRAGFDSQSALSGVNRFLKFPGGENYSAADVAVCDLATGNVDIIKIGSPPCYIRTADTVLKIEGSSLPIGVLDEMRPYAATKKLYPGQMLILVTDGVSDCFDGDALPEFINSLAALNPERVATSILDRALLLSGGTPKDDMTVIAFRLFKRKKSLFLKSVIVDKE